MAHPTGSWKRADMPLGEKLRLYQARCNKPDCGDWLMVATTWDGRLTDLTIRGFRYTDGLLHLLPQVERQWRQYRKGGRWRTFIPQAATEAERPQPGRMNTNAMPYVRVPYLPIDIRCPVCGDISTIPDLAIQALQQ